MSRGAGRSRNSLGTYLLEIQRFPIPTAEQEKLAAPRLRTEEGIHWLVESNLRFVVRIAREYQGGPLPLEDLISEGNLGLIKAAKRFDPSRGTRFLSCAVWWIRKAILDALERKASLIHVPRYQLDKARRNQTRLVREVSLGHPVKPDSEQTLGDLLEDTRTDGPAESLLRQEARERIRRALFRLGRRERRVLAWRFGLGDRPTRTLGEVGESLGISREAVRQIESRAGVKLRRILARGETPARSRPQPRKATFSTSSTRRMA